MPMRIMPIFSTELYASKRFKAQIATVLQEGDGGAGRERVWVFARLRLFPQRANLLLSLIEDDESQVKLAYVGLTRLAELCLHVAGKVSSFSHSCPSFDLLFFY